MSRPLKILTISAIYPSEVSRSEGKSVASLDRALAEECVEGTTLVLRPWLPRWLAGLIPRYRHLAVRPGRTTSGGLSITFGRYLHLPAGIRLDASARFMALRAWREAGRLPGFDVIHGQSIYPAALAAQLLARRLGTPFIITLRDDLGHFPALLARGGPRLAAMYAAMFAEVGAIVVHGPALLKAAPALLPPGKRIPVRMIPNGVDFEGIAASIRGMPPAGPSAGVRILSVGNLFRLKGIHECLHALARLRDEGIAGWSYRVVGDGPYRLELMGLAESLGLKDEVEFAGRVPYEDAVREIAGCDIFCLPSSQESFGNVYAEAAACGKPCIGCSGQGAELTIRHGETGLLVPARDVQTLASALKTLLLDPGKARAMGERARERIREFTWERAAKTYIEVMREAAAGFRARRGRT